MKDLGPLYDPAVEAVIGWNPNAPEAPVPQDQSSKPMIADKAAPFDVAFEFAEKIKETLGKGNILGVNPYHLLVIQGNYQSVTRTYYSYLPGEPGTRQQFNKAQQLKLKRRRNGSFSVAGIHLTRSGRDQTWEDLRLELDRDKTTIDARGKGGLRTLKLEYEDDDKLSAVHLNGVHVPKDEYLSLIAGVPGIWVCERDPSSVVAPNQLRSAELSRELALDAGLALGPADTQDLSDMRFYKSLDPMKQAKILWIP